MKEKPKVHYALLEDMKKYIKDFNPDDYEKDSNITDVSLIRYLRNYYNEHLPVDVTAWMRVNEPNEDLIYAKGLGRQVCFIRDEICSLLRTSYEDWEENPPMVISTHFSKSVELPVYQIDIKDYGVEMILRYNFYDWKVSIKSKKSLDFDAMGLFDPAEAVSVCCCEGFPVDKIYGSYEQNHKQFTIEIRNNYELYAFMYFLKSYLGIKKKD